MAVGSVLLTASLWRHHHLPASCDWRQPRPWAWKWPQPCSPSCWARCQPAFWSGPSPGGPEAPGGRAWSRSWRPASCPKACSAQRRCSPCPQRSRTDLSKDNNRQRHYLASCKTKRWRGTSPVRCIMGTPTVCDRLTMNPRLSTICSWNFSSQWAKRKIRKLSLTSILSLKQILYVKYFMKRATTWTYAWRTSHWWSWHRLGSGRPWWSRRAYHQSTLMPTHWWNSEHFFCPGSLSWSDHSCSASCCSSQTRQRKRRNWARTGGCWSSTSCCVSHCHSALEGVRRWRGWTLELSNAIWECQRLGIGWSHLAEQFWQASVQLFILQCVGTEDGLDLGCGAGLGTQSHHPKRGGHHHRGDDNVLNIFILCHLVVKAVWE